MIYLHQYPAVWGLPSLSPFCMKVETYLRMINLPYQIIVENNPAKGPKGKMPVLRDDDIIIADSTFIIQYLQKKYLITLDLTLSVEKIAIAHAVQKMVEENLYYVLLYSRWIDLNGKEYIDQIFRQFFPKLLAGFALKWIRRNLNKQAYSQGIGRHTRDEIYQIGEKDISALSDLLGQTNQFFLSNSPHTIDATVYAFLATIINCPYNSPLKEAVMKHANLISYCNRMSDKYFHDVISKH